MEELFCWLRAPCLPFPTTFPLPPGHGGSVDALRAARPVPAGAPHPPLAPAERSGDMPGAVARVQRDGFPAPAGAPHFPLAITVRPASLSGGTAGAFELRGLLPLALATLRLPPLICWRSHGWVVPTLPGLLGPRWPAPHSAAYGPLSGRRSRAAAVPTSWGVLGRRPLPSLTCLKTPLLSWRSRQGVAIRPPRNPRRRPPPLAHPLSRPSAGRPPRLGNGPVAPGLLGRRRQRPPSPSPRLQSHRRPCRSTARTPPGLTGLPHLAHPSPLGSTSPCGRWPRLGVARGIFCLQRHRQFYLRTTRLRTGALGPRLSPSQRSPPPPLRARRLRRGTRRVSVRLAGLRLRWSPRRRPLLLPQRRLRQRMDRSRRK